MTRTGRFGQSACALAPARTATARPPRPASSVRRVSLVSGHRFLPHFFAAISTEPRRPRTAALSSPQDSPHIRARWRNPRQAEKAERTRRAPTRAKAARPDDAGRRRTRSPTCSIRHRQGHRRHGLRHRACSRRRTIRSTAAPISPPRTGAQVDAERLRARRRSATTPASPVTGLDPELAQELGLGERRAPSRPSRATRARSERTRRRAIRNTGCRRADLPQPGSGLASMGVAATAQALETSAARGPAGIRRSRPLDAAPAAAAGEIRRRQALRHQVRLRAEGRPAAGDQGTGRGRQAPRPHAGAARRHRLGQDLHHGQGDRGDAAPGAHPRAQQDAGGAALRRVQELLPRQRGRVFRHLLRLLPAGSLRPAHRHLYREGILDQRADRPHAPFGDARAARARRRHHRRLGVVHLRHRLGRDLFGDDLHAQAGRQRSTSAS